MLVLVVCARTQEAYRLRDQAGGWRDEGSGLGFRALHSDGGSAHVSSRLGLLQCRAELYGVPRVDFPNSKPPSEVDCWASEDFWAFRLSAYRT